MAAHLPIAGLFAAQPSPGPASAPSLGAATAPAQSGGDVNPRDTAAEPAHQFIVFSELPVRGPARFIGRLREPQAAGAWYHDLGVLAVPLPTGEGGRLCECGVRLAAQAGSDFIAALLCDGAFSIGTSLAAGGGPDAVLRLEFDHRFQASGLTVGLESPPLPGGSPLEAEIQAVDESGVARSLRRFVLCWPVTCVGFPQARSREYRLVLLGEAATVPLTEIDLYDGPRIENLPSQLGLAPVGEPSRLRPAEGSDLFVKLEEIRDLAGATGSDGQIVWDVPAGRWSLLRVGATAMPAAAPGQGPSSNAKAGGNWATGFRASFQARRGYDPLPWLVAATGRYVNHPGATQRFLDDWRATLGEASMPRHAQDGGP